MSASDELELAFPSLQGRGPRQLVEAMTAAGPVGLAWLPYAKAIVSDGRLRPALRELVVLRVAWRSRSAYVWGGHALMAADAGLVLDPARTWAADEALALAAVDELLTAGRLEESTRLRAIRQWTAGELMELVMVIGQYQMLSLLGEILEFSAEPGCPSVPATWPGAPVR